MINKKCIICKKKFIPFNNYHKYCSKKCYKKSSKYKQIQKEYMIQYKKIPSNIKKKKIYMKKYHKSFKYKQYKKKFDVLDRRKKYKKEYNKRENYKIYQKKYKQTNKYKKSQELYRHSKHGKVIAIIKSANRRAYKHNCIHSFTKDEWISKCKKIKNICPCCYTLFDNKEYKLSLDHIPSLASANKKFIKTGIKQIYTIDDIQPLCLKCNTTKGDKDITIKELRKIRKLNDKIMIK